MALGDTLKKGIVEMAEEAYGQNNLLSDLEGIYGTDLTEQELAAGIRPTAEAAGTPTYGIPEFDRYRFASRNQRALPSMYQLYLGGGFPEETTDPIQDFTGGETIGTGAGDVAQIPGATDFLATVPDYSNVTTATEPPGSGDPDMFYDATPDYSNVTTATEPPGSGDPDMFYDATPDYSGVGLTSPKRSGQDIVTRTEPVTLEPVQPGITNPRVSQEVRDALAQTPPGGGDPDMFYDEPVNLVEQDFSGRPVLAARGVTTPDEQDYTYDPMNPPMLGDEGASMDYMSGSLDAPYGVNPNTGVPYQTPRTIADQNRVLGVVSQQDTSESLYQKAKDYLGENVAGAIDWTGTAVRGLINNYVGKPITLLFDALGAMDLPGGPTAQTSKAIELGLVKEGETQDIYGINTQSQLGNYDKYNVNRVEELKNALENAEAKYDTEEEYLNMTTRLRKELEDRKEYVDRSGAGGDITPDATELDIATGNLLGDGVAMEEAQDLNLMDVQDEMAGVETGDAAEAERIAAEDRAAAQQAARDKAAAEAAARAVYRHRGNGGNGGNGGSTGSGGGYTGGGWCFDPNTFVQMADGSEKKIKEIQLGDNTKGGEVTGVFQFKASDEIHDYKGVTVAGSHYVKEGGKFIMVQDSPISVKIDKIPVVYSLDHLF